MKLINIILYTYLSVISAYNYILNIGSTGLLLPYSLGIIGYIKKNTNNYKYELIGTSGGAYCSLLYKYEKDLSVHDYIWKDIFGLNEKTKIDLYNMREFQNDTINILSKRYNKKLINENEKINIVATKYNNFLNSEKIIFNEFKNISDLIYKCHSSSYIPYISGKNLYYVYDNSKYYDSVFNLDNRKIYKYVEDKKIINKVDNEKIIHINCYSWGRKWDMDNKHYLDYKTSKTLFDYGWEDTKKYFKYIF